MCVISVEDTVRSWTEGQHFLTISHPFSFLGLRPWYELAHGRLQSWFDEYNNLSWIKLIWNAEQISMFDDGNSRQDSQRSLRLHEGQRVYGFRCERVDSRYMYPSLMSSLFIRRGIVPMHDRPTESTLEPSDLKRLELCSRALNKYGLNSFCWTTVHDRIGNWPSRTVRLPETWNDTSESEIQGIIIAGIGYGGLHLLTWNAPFSSRAEQILWRFSGLLIPASIANLLALKSFKNSTAFFLAISLALGYLLARVFLVVECFLQLARLPQSAYLVPSWSQYFPHL